MRAVELLRTVGRWLAIIAVLAVVGVVAIGEIVAFVAPPPVRMPGGDVVERGVSEALEAAFDSIVADERLHFVVQFRRELTARETVDIGRGVGIDLDGPVPEHAYITSVTKVRWPDVRDALRKASPPATRIFEIRPADRLAPEWGEAAAPRVPGYARLPPNSVAVFVRFFDDVPEAGQRQVLADADASQPGRPDTLAGPIGVWEVVIPEAGLVDLARNDAVRFIEPTTPPVELDMDLARGDIGVPALADDGTGSVIAQWEGCQAAYHTDTAGRITRIGIPANSCLDLLFQDRTANNRFDIDEPIGVDVDDDGSVDRMLFDGGSVSTVAAPWLKLQRFVSEDGKLYVKKANGDPAKLETDDIELRNNGIAGTVTPELVMTTPSPVVRLSRYSAARHPTLVAGIMISNSNSETTSGGDPLYPGVAPAARIRTHAWNHLSRTIEYPAAIAAGARVSSNSFGWSNDYHFVAGARPYTGISQFYDAVSSGRAPNGTANGLGARILVVGSSGNAGDRAVFWRTARIVNSAKNVLAVGNVSSSAEGGSSDSLGVPAHDSGRGPTRDGRLTPMLVAPGDQLKCQVSGGVKTCGPDGTQRGIVSTVPGSGYEQARGTSFSTPIVSGAAELLSRVYEDACSVVPAPADLRALMIHSARDLTDASNLAALQTGPALVGPDQVFGYGLLQADKAAALVRHTVTDEITSGWVEHRVFLGSDSQLVGKAGEKQLQVTLVWDDVPYYHEYPPRTETGILQNDIDLEVIDPDGNRHLPWVLDTSPGNEGKPATRRTRPPLLYVLQAHRDHANTVEQVVVDVPLEMMQRTWTIRVRDFRIRRAPQMYTLVSEAFLQDSYTDCGAFSNGETRRIAHPFELPDTPLAWVLFWVAVIILLWLTFEALLWLYDSSRAQYGTLIALLLVVAALVLLAAIFWLIHIRQFLWLSWLAMAMLLYALWRATR